MGLAMLFQGISGSRGIEIGAVYIHQEKLTKLGLLDRGESIMQTATILISNSTGASRQACDTFHSDRLEVSVKDNGTKRGKGC